MMALFDRFPVATGRPLLVTCAVLCAAGAAGVPATAHAASSGTVGFAPVTAGPVTGTETTTLPTTTRSVPPVTLTPTIGAAVTPVTTAPPAGTASVKGSVVSVDGASFTIQRSGSRGGVINEMTDYATALAARDYPYVWGGGHARAQIASVGSRGPGYNGKSKGFDCSGTVAAVLAAAGLWPKTSGVPNDAGVIQYLLQHRLIAKGPGTGPYEVTLYDDPGVHIFMNIDGRFFGTSDGSGGGDAKGGPGWLSDEAYDALNTKRFKRYHLLPSVLKDRDSYLHDITFRYANGAQALEAAAALTIGSTVKVGYGQTNYGGLSLSTISFPGSTTVNGTVSGVLASGGLTVTTSAGKTLTLVAPLSSLTLGVTQGDTVTVTYTRQGSTLTARAVTVTGTPAMSQIGGKITRIGAGGKSLTVQASSGQSLVFVTDGSDVLSGYAVGDTVDVTYYPVSGGALTLEAIQQIAPVPVTGTGTVTQTVPGIAPPVASTVTTPKPLTTPTTATPPPPTPTNVVVDRSGGAGIG